MRTRGVAIIINPTSGSFRRADLGLYASMAKSLGASLTVMRTERAGHATELAREASRDGFDLVIAAGGDGTVNEVINGLVGTPTPMGIVPLGTANVLVREAGLPVEPAAAFRAALTRQARPISLGRIEATGELRHFCIVAGSGLDSDVVHNINMRIKKLIGKGAYVLQAMVSLIRWNSRLIEVTVDGMSASCFSVFACKARKYAGDFVIAPGADIAQPEFEVLLMTGRGRLRMLLFALAFLLGMHTRLGTCRRMKASEVLIGGSHRIQLDGDDFALSPARITVARDALRLVH